MRFIPYLQPFLTQLSAHVRIIASPPTPTPVSTTAPMSPLLSAPPSSGNQTTLLPPLKQPGETKIKPRTRHMFFDAHKVLSGRCTATTLTTAYDTVISLSEGGLTVRHGRPLPTTTTHPFRNQQSRSSSQTCDGTRS